MPDLVRVRDGKWEFNRGRAFAEAHGMTILEDEATHLPDGRPRPTTRAGGRRVKPRTTVEAAARKKATQKRSDKRAPKTSTSDSAATPQDADGADVANPAADPENSTAAGDTADEPTQKEP